VQRQSTEKNVARKHPTRRP